MNYVPTTIFFVGNGYLLSLKTDVCRNIHSYRIRARAVNGLAAELNFACYVLHGGRECNPSRRHANFPHWNPHCLKLGLEGVLIMLPNFREPHCPASAPQQLSAPSCSATVAACCCMLL